MKKLKNLAIYSILILMLFETSCIQSGKTDLNRAEFSNPPSSRSVHAWWHWMENAITKEGITKDLEAMSQQGISAVTILNVSLFNERDLGIPGVLFNTAEWYGMFEWALAEAKRLGMTVGVHNCDGWSTTGGPWIDPENSMKQCVWSKTYLTGGGQVEINLPEPGTNSDFYRDINVIAYPATGHDNSFRIARPAMLVNSRSMGDILYDANPFSTIPVNDNTVIDFFFEQEHTFSAIALHPRVRFDFVSLRSIHFRFELKASSDGKSFTTVGLFEGPAMNRTTILEIPAVKAKFYRIEFRNVSGSNKLHIGELELIDKNQDPSYHTAIPFHLEKTVTTMAHGIADFRVQGTSAPDVLNTENILDITQYMNSDGILKWDAPAGEWEILRIGYTTTGAVNFPASAAGTGLECDKMDTAALNLHFRSFPAKLIDHAGEYTGNTFEYLFIDSWECEFQNWTAEFKREFKNRRKYDMIRWFPVICGLTVDSPEATERFLQDYQKTVAELIEENYYAHYSRLCAEKGLKLHAEVIYGGTTYPPLDVLRSNRYADVPMYEFWARADDKTGFIDYTPGPSPAYPMPVNAAALYGKNIIPAEAYTGYAFFSETPWDLKLYGDRAYCSGINQMVLHSYVHQPSERKPGITLWEFGHSFNRHNPWWDFASQWFMYQSRVQSILQRGTPCADILYYTGDRFYPGRDTATINMVPEEFRVQKINLDILRNHCRVKNGKILLDNGLSYEMLLLHNDIYMNVETLRLISKLAKDGAIIAGVKPLKVPGLFEFAEREKELNELTSAMWGNGSANSYGKGKIYSGRKLQEVLEQNGISPDFSVDSGSKELIFIHKKTVNDDVFFVVNQSDEIIESECTFKVTGKYPELWDPLYGTVSIPSDFRESDGKSIVDYRFRPRESVFFVFRKRPSTGKGQFPEFENKFTPDTITTTLTFEDLPLVKAVPVANFSSWTSFDEPDVKYYSGKVKYTFIFDLPEEIAVKNPLTFSVGGTSAPYEIRMNGKLLGSASFPEYRFDVSSVVKTKGNVAEIRLASPYRNRVIGDLTQSGSLQNLWTTLPENALPGKDKPLLESGIKGPVVFNY
jgi:hypothetical protein